MKLINKTRYAILGALLEGPASGYEIKSFMKRSTIYFWRESDSTIYPMLKVLANEGKVLLETTYIGKKKKEIFSITELGRTDFKNWMQRETSEETPRNEFLLKLFFATDPHEIIHLFRKKLEKTEEIYQAYKNIEDRLEKLDEYPRKAIRLKSLRYGMAQLKLEMTWLQEGILEYVNH